jgi:YHS domain-containing protein
MRVGAIRPQQPVLRRPPSANREELSMVKDPVCGMTIDEKTAAGKSDYKGQTYYFCATVCKTKFDADPAKYAGANR